MRDFLEVRTSTPSYPASAASIYLGALILELHQEPGRGYTVQAWQQAGTMQQIRDLSIEHGTEDMPRSQLAIPACSVPLDCPVDEFARELAARIHTDCLDPTLRPFIEAITGAANAGPGGAAASAVPPDPQNSAASNAIVVFIMFVAVGLAAAAALGVLPCRRRGAEASSGGNYKEMLSAPSAEL